MKIVKPYKHPTYTDEEWEEHRKQAEKIDKAQGAIQIHLPKKNPYPKDEASDE